MKDRLTINPRTESIQEVIEQLNVIINWAVAHNSSLGYFPCLYRQVTIRVSEGIHSGRFKDCPEVERLDVEFANRYFEALDLYFRQEKPTQSWQLAFDTADNNNALIFQHIMLGMNAHINLDLGIATGKLNPGKGFDGLESDFIEINVLLSEMVEVAQQQINHLSPFWWLIDILGGKQDEQFASINLKRSRAYAWNVALRTAKTPPEDHPTLIEEIDLYTHKVGRGILYPPPIIRFGLAIIRWWERKKHPAK